MSYFLRVSTEHKVDSLCHEYTNIGSSDELLVSSTAVGGDDLFTRRVVEEGALVFAAIVVAWP